jgi:hypothetical protein
VLDSDELRIGRREPFDDQDPEPESNETEKSSKNEIVRQTEFESPDRR